MKSKKFFLIVNVIALLAIPMLGGLAANKGQLPPNFLNFPPLEAVSKAGFNIWVFLIIGALCLFVSLLYITPGWFGFKKKQNDLISKPKSKLPFWFWVGSLISLSSIILLWGKFASPQFWVYNGYIFVFLGLIFILDGIVYARQGGKSLVADYPVTFLIIAFASCIGWLYYEYLNFFVDENWYYPKAYKMSKLSFNIYAAIGSATLVPVVFEMYQLMLTFGNFRYKYSYGPKMELNLKTKYLTLGGLYCLMFLVPFLPNYLFPFLWVGPPAILAIALSIKGIWSPLTDIKTGNWSYLAIMSLAGFIMGFLWEGNNYMSAVHDPFFTNVPGYWIYSIPYVDKFHVFEMPLLGMFGYMPYGANNWIWWIVLASLINRNQAIEHK